MKTRPISALLCTLTLLGLLTACGGSSYRDDVLISDLVKAVDSSINGAEAMIEAPNNYISGTMKMNVSDYAGYCVKLNSMGVNADEYGIFKGMDENQTQEIKKAIEDYFQLRKDIWMPEYMPQEYPKLENAEIKVAGNYLIYAILSDSERAAVFAAFDAALK